MKEHRAMMRRKGLAEVRLLALFAQTAVLAPALVLSMVAGGLAIAPSASAQEIQITGPLAGQPAVRRMRQYRVDRVQLIVPTVGYTLQDEFARSLMVGLEANVHFTDFLGVGVWGAAANFGNSFFINSDLTNQVSVNGQTTGRNRLSMPTPANFEEQVARLQGVVSAHLLFAPLRGKLSLFQGVFVDADFYILAGFALAFVQERADVTATGICGGAANDPACLATQTARKDRIAPAPIFGVGLNMYFNSWLGLAIQWRAFPFNMNPAGTDEAGGTGGSVSIPDGLINDADQRFYFHHMINVGLIINLPPDASSTQ
jgi:outer membrane beta-barrel protein